MSENIVRDNPHWLPTEKGVRLSPVFTNTALAELVNELSEILQAHPDAKVEFSYDADPYGGMGDFYLEITWEPEDRWTYGGLPNGKGVTITAQEFDELKRRHPGRSMFTVDELFDVLDEMRGDEKYDSRN